MHRGLVTRRLLLVLLLAACSPFTTRPYFPPVTGAAQAEIELELEDATETLAAVLRSDSLPVTRVELRDGYIETAWFDAATKAATGARRLGSGVVQIRAWVDPSRQGHSVLTVETVYRPLADPSLSPRDLDRQVPPDHVIGKRVTEIVTELARLYSSEAPPAP
jgi:hypothetical protein